MSERQNKQGSYVATRLFHRSDADKIQVEIDGQAISAYVGETVAAVLMVSGSRTFTQTNAYNLARTLFCGMGVCHQCLVTVDEIRDVRACMTKVHPGMKIETHWRIETNEAS
jgi:predicted molibdopterin-dependent oxidoreductase YjgC